jgi:hypothetical protein
MEGGFLSPAAFPPHGVQSAASALAKAFGLISRYRRLKVVSPKAVGTEGSQTEGTVGGVPCLPRGFHLMFQTTVSN